ncbi:PAS domain-containing protein, partial [Sandarakinorhabdus sp.]|uniref:PAS domain-containing protein n=1 Tax=Sandarakinorhabdus sp. TaxID=1916663 RepID=UPI0028B0DBAD
MTAMLKPPVQMVRDLGWRQVLGLDQADDGFWAEVRGQQLSQLNRNVPFNIGLLTINLVTVLAAFGDVVAFSALAPWLGGIGGLAVFWTLRAIRLRPGPGTPQASRSLYWRVTAEIAALALFWAGLLQALAPALPADSQAVLMLFSLIFLGAVTNCAATMPVAVLLVCVAIAVGMVRALPDGAPLDHPLMLLGLASFVAIKLRSALVTTYHTMARLKSEADLSEQGEVVRLLLNEYESNGSDWLLELDGRGCLTHVTTRFADVARRRRADMLGQPLLALLDPVQGGATTAALAHALREREAFRDLVVPVPLGRDLRWWALSGTPKQDVAGNFTGFRGVGRDVTEVRRSQERIAQLARFDPLTGLANRSLFRESLDDLVENAALSGRPAALLFV